MDANELAALRGRLGSRPLALATNITSIVARPIERSHAHLGQSIGFSSRDSASQMQGVNWELADDWSRHALHCDVHTRDCDSDATAIAGG